MADLRKEIERRRTFAIISHPDAGKTTLTEKLLLYGGAIQLAGSVKGKATARHAVSDGIKAGIDMLPGVAFSRLIVNDTGQTDAYSIPAHSLCAVVEGGTDTDIAGTLFLRKSPGVGTYGSTSVQITDAFGGQHTVSFIRGTVSTAAVSIVLKKLPGYNEQAMSAAIPEAIAAYISTLGIGEKLVVPVLYGIAYAADPSETPTFTVLSIRVSAASQSSAEVITPAFSQRIRCLPITVQITISE